MAKEIQSLRDFDHALNEGSFPITIRILPVRIDDETGRISHDFAQTCIQPIRLAYHTNMGILRHHAKKRDSPEAILSVNPGAISTHTYIIDLVRIKSAKRLLDEQDNRVSKCNRDAQAEKERKGRQKYYDQCLSVLTDEEMKKYEVYYAEHRLEDTLLQFVRENVYPLGQYSIVSPLGAFFRMDRLGSSNTDLFHRFVQTLEKTEMNDIYTRLKELVDAEESAIAANEKGEEEACEKVKTMTV